MPFTPFHMGPGIAVKALLQGSFSLMVFGWSQIVMDIQPLIALVSREGTVHGFTHTYSFATFLAVFSAITGKYLAQWALTTVLGVNPAVAIRWPTAFLSAFVGTYSHVVLDSVMHADITPLWPFSESNELLRIVSLSTLHRFCLYSGLIGAVVYLAINRWLAIRIAKTTSGTNVSTASGGSK